MDGMGDITQMLNWPLLQNAKKIGLKLLSDMDQKAIIIGGWAIRNIYPLFPINTRIFATDNINKKVGYLALFLSGATTIKIFDSVVGRRRPYLWVNDIPDELKTQLRELLQNPLLSYRISEIHNRSTWRQCDFRFKLHSENFTYIPILVKIQFYNEDFRLPHLMWSLILTQVEKPTYIEITVSRDTILRKRLYHLKSEYVHENGDIQRLIQQMWWDIEPGKIRRPAIF